MFYVFVLEFALDKVEQKNKSSFQTPGKVFIWRDNDNVNNNMHKIV
jgi:hypothetical protein